MALIVLMEDDAATRMLVTSVLRKEGHEVLAAEDGAQGLLLIQARSPDLVVSDVQMPEVNGFQVLAELRANARTATIPVILLTSLQERAAMRVGMTTGADDYITKPFRPTELREAVAAQLNKGKVRAAVQAMAVDAAVRTALDEQRHQLAQLYEERLAAELSERWPADTAAAGDERFASATLMFIDVPQYVGVAHRLNADEQIDLIKRFYGNAKDAAHLFGARYMQFVGQGLLAVFTDDSNTRTVNHALRAARSVLGLLESSRGIRQYLHATYPERQLPDFAVHAALNTGEVALAQLSDPLHGGSQKLPVGEAVTLTVMLQKEARALHWPVAVTAATLRHLGASAITGRRALVPIAGASRPADAAELTGLQP